MAKHPSYQLLGLIPARGGSQGIRGKNLRTVGGTSLVGRAIAVGRACPSLARVIVSTDSEEIAQAARACGGEVPFLRPAELATHSAGMMPVVEHALAWVERESGRHWDGVVLLDPTAPLRTAATVERAIALFAQGDCDAVVSGSPAHRSPHFNMVRQEQGYARLVIESAPGAPPVVRRQDAPPVWDLNTVVWIWSRRAILELKSRLPERTRLCEVSAREATDIDHEHDLYWAEYLLSRTQETPHG